MGPMSCIGSRPVDWAFMPVPMHPRMSPDHQDRTVARIQVPGSGRGRAVCMVALQPPCFGGYCPNPTVPLSPPPPCLSYALGAGGDVVRRRAIGV